MLYLSPSLRRKYIDDTLKSSTDNYSEYIKKYKYILLNRNKTLKYIAKNIKNKSEILFWNNEFLNICEKIYIERFNFINFI
jgi:recombinational DNA repair ATPase RecF